MTKNETIVDRVVSRLKAQPLGDLITEEDLHDIVKEAIPRTFFEKRHAVQNAGSYHERRTELEPLIVEVMRDLLKPTVREAVEQWLVANAELTQAHWQKVLDAGLLDYVQKIQNDMATVAVRDMLRAWTDSLNQERMRAGLPMLMAI
jgi:hypothetical protein